MTMTKGPQEQLDALLTELKSIIESAEAEGRELTDEEAADADAKAAEAERLKAHIARAKENAERYKGLFGTGQDEERDPATGEWSVKSKGAAKGKRLALTGPAVKSAAARIAPQIEASRRKTFLAPGTTELFAIPVQPDIVEAPRIPTSILDLLTLVQRDKPVWDYLEQATFVNNAAVVSPGQEKPVSEVTLRKVRNQLSVIAHLTQPVDKYLLEDYDQLQTFVSGQLLLGLGRALEHYVLNGDGTDSNGDPGGIVGLLNRSGLQLLPYDAGTDKVTKLRLAATQIETLGYEPGAYIINPLDWADIETTRATSGSFDLGGPIDRAARKVWGTQVVTSTGVPQGTAVLLDTDAAVIDTDTEGVRAEWDKSQGFTRNEIQGRVEGRFGLSVLHPDAVIKIELAEPTAEA